MKLTLTKAQITDLYHVLRKSGHENTELYGDLHNLLRITVHVPPSREMELDIDDNDLSMVREALTPPRRDE